MICTYYQRAEWRNIDDMIGPHGLTAEQAEAVAEREQEEDRRDPPCGRCDACLQSDEHALPFPADPDEAAHFRAE